MAPTAHLQASGKPGQVRRRLRSQPAGQLELLPGFSRPFRAWENGVANPGRRSPAGFALGYSLLPRRGCQQDGVTAPRASAITEESAGWNKRKTIGVVLKHLTFRLMRVPYKSTGVKPY